MHGRTHDLADGWWGKKISTYITWCYSMRTPTFLHPEGCAARLSVSVSDPPKIQFFPASCAVGSFTNTPAHGKQGGCGKQC